MHGEPKYRVIGIHEGGERVIVTTPIAREMAEQIADLIRPNSNFDDLIIEIAADID